MLQQTYKKLLIAVLIVQIVTVQSVFGQERGTKNGNVRIEHSIEQPFQLEIKPDLIEYMAQSASDNADIQLIIKLTLENDMLRQLLEQANKKTVTLFNTSQQLQKEKNHRSWFFIGGALCTVGLMLLSLVVYKKLL